MLILEFYKKTERKMHFDKLFFLLLTSLVLMGCANPKNKSIKVMTWNILHGGLHGSKFDNFKKDTSNTLNIVKVLQQKKRMFS